jgi:hypothetical protein
MVWLERWGVVVVVEVMRWWRLMGYQCRDACEDVGRKGVGGRGLREEEMETCPRVSTS